MEGRARCHGAATIINGIATGLGASFGIGLRTDAYVRLTDEADRFDVEIGNDPGEDTSLAAECVKVVLERSGLSNRYGAVVRTDSDIPISRGLKSSSAASNAIVLATLKALGRELDDMAVIDMGIEASFRSGVTITGAFDDATASYFGGALVTDNIKRRILRRYLMDDHLVVLVHVPDAKIRKRSVDIKRLAYVGPELKAAHDLALKGDYREAMMRNGLIYGSAMGLDTTLSQKAIEHGAQTAGISGTGPATVILCREEDLERVLPILTGGQIIRTQLNTEKAHQLP